ncbi:MAG: sugar phosphate nucleotidyltransferase [Nitrospirota bacterium]
MDQVSAIVLAGGNGHRVDQFIQRLEGRACPKQYHVFTGRRSMLQHTLDRVEMLIPRERIFTVVSPDHAEHVARQLGDRPTGTVIAQPRNLETLPGILLPLTHIRKRDPHATVAVFPSDHFVWDEAKFMEYVRAGVSAVEQYPDKLVLLGVKPDAPESDYGWIAPGGRVPTADGSMALKVRSFCEKPGPNRGDVFLRNGYLWNTLVFVAKAATLYAMARDVAPHMVAYFDVLSYNIGMPSEPAILRGMYARMESMNISRDLFQKTANRLFVLPVEGIGWSDWGRAERIVETLDRYGLSLRRPVSPYAERADMPAALHA